MFNGLAAGSYTVTAKSSAGCTGTTSVILGTNVCQGVTISVSATSTDAGAGQSNGSVTVTAGGGAGFTYQLGTGAFQSSNVFSGLAAGSYTVTAKSSAGCTGTATVTVNSNACLGITVAVTYTKTDPFTGQSNGSITASATGGTGPFTYQVNGGAFQTSNVFSGLPAGTYTITAKNSTSCVGTASVTLVGANPCTGVNIVVSGTPTNPGVNLSNGSISVAASGSTNFTYQLNNGAFQASNVFSGLGIGTYTITAKDGNGCTGSVQVVLSNPCTGVTIAVTGSKTDAAPGQNNGTITASASGGTGTYTYQLNSGAFQASNVFNGLAVGSYTLTAKSAAGCTGTTTVTIANACTGVTITVTTVKVDALPGKATGSISASASGGTAPYTYQLNGGAFQSSNVFSGLAAGAYVVTAKSAAGCTGSAASVTINSDACAGKTVTLTPQITNVVPISCGIPQNNGAITIVAGGSTGFTYSFDNGASYSATNILSNVYIGTYNLAVKDVDGCVKTSTANVANAPAGPLYATVKSIIASSCSGVSCHTNNGGANGGVSFDTDCNILDFWSDINQSAVVNGDMPIAAPLTTAQKNAITSWINAGHTYDK